ncbi:MAG TPA: metallophosphoesterase [Candidatus Thermoplasmatota archaeon]|nr:metallophosphoesterase [Candidatus Thermoplasmatota archaeon]
MKKIAVLCGIILLILPVSSVATSGQNVIFSKTESADAGEIIAVSCSEPYPTLGQPVYLLITMQGKAGQQFNETISITDEFSGFAMTNGEMKWISGNLIENQKDITIGILPKYTSKILWYPSVVGNHTLHVSVGESPEKQLNVSVSFDVEGIITPSLGCPAIISKDVTNQLSMTLSGERSMTDEPAQITKVTLQSIDGTGSYQLEDQLGEWYTWINAGADIVEDDSIVSYDIDSVPEGFYNITVITTTANYTWPHAVQLLNTEPSNYTIVQLADIHIGKYSNFVNKKKELIRLFTSINENIHPDFIILSGDSVDWYNQKSKRNVYADLKEAILNCETPVYTVPGNHERYANSLLFLYFPFTNLTPYHRFLNPLNDYSLIYGNMNFVFLDSGYEYSRWEIQPQIWNTTPEGSGLSNTQMYLLENIWGAPQMKQMIIMHHPAVADTNDTGFGALPNDLPSGNNECIAFNRGAFITYCLEKNVSLVLTGHTHKNHVFTSLGKEATNDTAWPLFIQTDSATMSRQNNGGRIIQIQNSAIVSYEYLPFS